MPAGAHADAGRMTKLFLHAGLPRTATTVLQENVFPKLENARYIGKNPDNVGLRGDLKPVDDARECCERILKGDVSGLARLQRLLPTVLHAIRLLNRERDREKAMYVAKLWMACVIEIARRLPDRALLYSDESLSESMSAITPATAQHGDAIVLEQLHELGMLQHTNLSVVLRDPIQFLKASYYKGMEFDFRYKREPASFRTYLQRQAEIFERTPSASRIFLASQRRASAHFQKLCPRTRIVTYEQLVKAEDTVTMLFGPGLSARKWPLVAFPRENSSWRNPEVNAFILSAHGVPAGLTIEEYALTFPETLEEMGLAAFLRAERLEPARAVAPTPQGTKS